MNNPPDLHKARERGREGAKRAADHADRMIPRWSDVALAFVRVYVLKTRPDDIFLTEEVRAAAKEWGLDDPTDGRAWGQVMRRAEREGVIKWVGYLPAASSNGSPKVAWRKA